MKVHTALSRGADHKNNCQDFAYCADTDNYFIGAVFDGCTSGKNSHFASILFGKILANIVEEYSADIDMITNHEELSKFILSLFIAKLSQVKSELNLTIDEMESTVVLMIYSKLSKWCYIVVAGDGFVSINGNQLTFENKRFEGDERGKDMPNYIAYDIDFVNDEESFDRWFNVNENKLFVENAIDITISSDGIFTFRQAKPSKGGEIDLIKFFTEDKKFAGQESMLLKKKNILENVYGLVHSDDLGIIRIIID
jgi:hypothetical protein